MANILMDKAGERMFVPPEKVPAFLDDGWKVVQQAEGSGQSPVISDQKAEGSEAVTPAAAPEAPEEDGPKSKRWKKGK